MGLQTGEILAPALMVFVWHWRCRCLAVLSYSSSRLSARLGADKRHLSSKCSLIASVTCASYGSSLTTRSFIHLTFCMHVFNWPKFLFKMFLFFVHSVLIWCGRLGEGGGGAGPCFPQSEPVQPLLVILTEKPEVITKKKKNLLLQKGLLWYLHWQKIAFSFPV